MTHGHLPGCEALAWGVYLTLKLFHLGYCRPPTNCIFNYGRLMITDWGSERPWLHTPQETCNESIEWVGEGWWNPSQCADDQLRSSSNNSVGSSTETSLKLFERSFEVSLSVSLAQVELSSDACLGFWGRLHLHCCKGVDSAGFMMRYKTIIIR